MFTVMALNKYAKCFSNEEPINFIDYLCSEIADAIINEFEQEAEEHEFAKKKKKTEFEFITSDLDLSSLPEDYFYKMVVTSIEEVISYSDVSIDSATDSNSDTVSDN